MLLQLPTLDVDLQGLLRLASGCIGARNLPAGALFVNKIAAFR